MSLKSGINQNLINSKKHILTWKFIVKFQNFSSVGRWGDGGLPPPRPAPKPEMCYTIFTSIHHPPPEPRDVLHIFTSIHPQT